MVPVTAGLLWVPQVLPGQPGLAVLCRGQGEQAGQLPGQAERLALSVVPQVLATRQAVPHRSRAGLDLVTLLAGHSPKPQGQAEPREPVGLSQSRLVQAVRLPGRLERLRSHLVRLPQVQRPLLVP